VKLARVTLDHLDGAVVAHLDGEIDLSNVEEIRALLVAAVDRDASALVLDLRATTYLDSTGVRLLFELAQRLHARRQRVRLVAADAAIVRRVVLLTHLEERVPIDDDVAGALAAIAAEEAGPA
jgi:anti-sigma B factor antagonist/stage II sporulation protein AA (anti-sigma F factor antagonist)